MSDLGELLERLGLAQYLDVFVSEGFDTWETILDITESDLNTLNVKLGHRRKLQRAIAESRGHSADRPLLISHNRPTGVEVSYRSDDSAPETKSRQAEPSAPGPLGTNAKRKYRRHPRPDEHAPDRPPSAYVIFSNQIRESLKSQQGPELSFTEIAKVVGERWQVLSAELREGCERQASAAKEKYYSELAEYKKTSQYDNYQKYLEEFKAKHAAPHKDGKRSKLETEISTSTTSSLEQTGRPMGRRISSVQADTSTLAQFRAENSPPIVPNRLPSAPLYPTQSTSPAIHSLSSISSISSINSPHTKDQYSPMSDSPRLKTLCREPLHRENSYSSYDLQPPSTQGRDLRGQPGQNIPSYVSAYKQTHSMSSSTTPPAYMHNYQPAPIELPSRRAFREPARLPMLNYEDTAASSEGSGTHQTISSEGSGAMSAVSYTGSTYFPVVDPQKSMRVLPQPVPSMGLPSSHLDRTPLPPLAVAQTSQQHTDYRANPSLAALLRAGELARVADDEEKHATTGEPG